MTLPSGNGQTDAAHSMSIVLASDHPSLTATIDESTLATSAKQDTGNTSLASVDTKLTKLSDGTQKAQRVDGSGNVTPAGDVASRAVFVQPGPVAAAPAVQNLALGTTAATQLASAVATRGVWVQALSTNTASIFLGPSGVTTGTGLELQAGDREFFPVDNANRLYAITGTITQNVRALTL